LKQGASNDATPQSFTPVFSPVLPEPLDDKEKGKFERLIQWIEEQGGKVEGVEVKYRPGRKERGVFSSKGINGNEPIVIIPKKLCISPELILAQPDIGPFLKGLMEEKTLSNMPDEFLFSLFLIHEKFAKKEKSFWDPYLQTLPEFDKVPSHPYFVSVEELQENKLWNLAKDFTTRQRNIINQVIPFVSQRKDLFPLSESDLLKELNLALFLVQSRTQLEEPDPRELIPFGDLFNHRTGFPLKITSSPEFRIYALDNTNIQQAGSEIYRNYGFLHPFNYWIVWGFGTDLAESAFLINLKISHLSLWKKMLLGRMECLATLSNLNVALNCAQPAELGLNPTAFNCLQIMELSETQTLEFEKLLMADQLEGLPLRRHAIASKQKMAPLFRQLQGEIEKEKNNTDYRMETDEKRWKLLKEKEKTEGLDFVALDLRRNLMKCYDNAAKIFDFELTSTT